MAKPTITAEEFAAWREDPVTQWIFAACAKAAEDCRAAWVLASWERNNVDPLLRTELFTYADAMRALPDTTHADWVKTHGEIAE